MKWAVDVARTE